MKEYLKIIVICLAIVALNNYVRLPLLAPGVPTIPEAKK